MLKVVETGRIFSMDRRMINVYKTLVRNPQIKRLLGRPRHR
jgi:hypothetical protein